MNKLSDSVVAACSDELKSGVVTLHPNGSANAMEFVTFEKPFCSGPVVVTATVNNHNTAGERVGVQAFGVHGVAVSIQLDAPSNADYDVYWVAVKATQ